MKVITFRDIEGTEREVHCPKGGFISYRYLLAKDQMGFSLHRTLIPVKEPQHWHYKNHLEACYCVSGKGEITNLSTSESWVISPGDLYVLDNHDDHLFQAMKLTELICIFNPPVKGNEVHKEDGSYES